MTTVFLDIPRQTPLHTYLADDVDIEPPCPPSLLEQAATVYSDLRQKLPWMAPANSDWLPLTCLMSWHNLREAIVVGDGNRLHIYVFSSGQDQQEGGGHWLTPIATPARPVKSVAWSPLSNTLVVGSNDGVYMWRLPSLDNEGVKASSFTHLPASALAVSLPERVRDLLRPPSALNRAADLLLMCPQGRLFCTVHSPASERRTLGQQLVVWDMYGLTGRPLPLSAGGPSSTLLSAATLGLVPLPGLNITCVQWSPSGQFIAVGCSNGVVVLVDTESWEQTPVCRVDGGGIEQLCWVTAVDCMLVQQQRRGGVAVDRGSGARGGLVYTLHLPDSGGGDRDKDLAETSAIHDTQLSSLPINLIDNRLKNLMQTFCLDKLLIDEPPRNGAQEEVGSELGMFCVVDIVTDAPRSDFIAVTFAYQHLLPEKSFKLPFVCLYLCSSRPHFSATFISIIDNQSSSNDGIDKLVVPEEVHFHRGQAPQRDVSTTRRDYSSAPVQMAVRWSNKVVSFSPCHVSVDRADYSS